MSLVPAPIARKLDASPKIINGWRGAWRYRSVQWSFIGFLTALANSIALAASATAFSYVVRPLIMWILVAVVFLGSMIGRIWYQPGISDKPDSSDGAGA